MQKQKPIVLDGHSLSIEEVISVVSNADQTVKVSNSALSKVNKAYKFITAERPKRVIYGVNTGFGPMASHLLGSKQLSELQLNLIRSHATGIGKPIPLDFVLSAMVVRLNTLAAGNSGVSPELLKRLEIFINFRIIPVVPEHGAVGTSGDLVQLAHIALALIGEGEVFYQDKRLPTEKVLKQLRIIQTYRLQPKEGLSLINGTSMMSGIAVILIHQSGKFLQLSIKSGAMSLELVNGFDDSFSEELNSLRPHQGQIQVAAMLRRILRSSKLLRRRTSFKRGHVFEEDVQVIPETVQEVYSLRCIPQVLGPISEVINNVRKQVLVEINSVTDNPIVDTKNKIFLHGGNFHGDYISLAMDQLKAVLVKAAMLSERRINFFLNNNINKYFPPFMNLKKPGLNLGLQALQFVATSTTAQNQTLAFPQYVHSISTNADNQDIVSMGTDSALIASIVLENSFVVLACEFVTLSQTVDFLDVSQKLSESSKGLFQRTRRCLPAVVEDRFIANQLNDLVSEIKN